MFLRFDASRFPARAVSVLGGNMLRVMDACTVVAHRLSRGHLEEEFPTAPL